MIRVITIGDMVFMSAGQQHDKRLRDLKDLGKSH